MISLTYFKLVISKAAKLTPNQWAAFLSNSVVPALKTADIDGDGKLSLRELVNMLKRILVSTLT